MSKKNKSQPSERQVDGLSFRGCSVESEMGEDSKPRVRMTISSETPVLTYVRFNGETVLAYEILDHSETSIDHSRMLDGLVIQDNHDGDQIGLIRSPVIVDRKMGGEVEFCSGERACEIAKDSANGLRKNSSVGYMVDHSSYRLEGELDGYPLVRAMRWTPYEGSFVNVPADTRVGVGRELEVITKPSVIDGKQGERTMNPKQMAELAKRANANGVSDKLAGIMETAETFEAAERALNDAIITAQREQIQSLKTVVPAKVDPVAQRTVAPVADPIDQKEMRRYSILNAIRSIDGENVDAGFEREVSQELAKQRGVKSKGIIIPFSELAKRVLTVSGTSSATVQTDVDGANVIDVLRTQSVLGLAGARFMPGLTGNVAIPRMTGGSTVYWVAENGTITGSTPTFDQVSGTPHTAGVVVELSRRLLQQSNFGVEMFVRNEIMERLIRGIQLAVFQGTGADGQPSNITTAGGINNPTVTQGTPTYAQLLDFPGSILADNATGNNQAWIGTGEVWAKCAATATNGAGSPLALDTASSMMIGKKFLTCEDVGANSLFFGDWNNLIIGIWGNGIDLQEDRTSLSTSGGLRLVGLQDVDVMVRHGEAFAYNAAVTS